MTHLQNDRRLHNKPQLITYRIIGDSTYLENELNTSEGKIIPFVVVSRVPPEASRDRQIFKAAPITVDIIPVPNFGSLSLEDVNKISLIQHALEVFRNHNQLSEADQNFIQYLNEVVKGSHLSSSAYRVGTSSMVLSAFGLGVNPRVHDGKEFRCYSLNTSDFLKGMASETHLGELLKYHYYRSSTELCMAACESCGFPGKKISHHDQEYFFKRSRDGTPRIVAVDAWRLSNTSIILPSALGPLDCFIVPPCFHLNSREQYSFRPNIFKDVEVSVNIDPSQKSFIPSIFAFRTGFRVILCVVLYPCLGNEVDKSGEPMIVFATSQIITSLTATCSKELGEPNLVLRFKGFRRGKQIEQEVSLWVNLQERSIKMAEFRDDFGYMNSYVAPDGIPARLSYPVDYLLMAYINDRYSHTRFVPKINVDSNWPKLSELD